MNLYEPCLRDARHHGIVVGVRIPDAPDPVPDPVLGRLPPEEAELARTLRGFRQVQFVGGRLACHEAAAVLGHPLPAVLSGPRGAPRATATGSQPTLSLSIAHKRDLAVAMVARSDNGELGVDLEDLLPARPRIAERVLTAHELAQVQALPEANQWTSVVVRFSVKEAIYKALAPRLQRYIDFMEAEVEPDPDGTCRVRLSLTSGPEPAAIDARYNWLPGRVLSSVQVRWG
ncbi:MAG: 4'-phosphopantetheinyl transferase superfamily protein [Alphaproteobacteria bacterium]|nr:4'-phosphopantetheinyl transferase superfamily protein [Alphaproteobacteria bacterium]